MPNHLDANKHATIQAKAAEWQKIKKEADALVAREKIARNELFALSFNHEEGTQNYELGNGFKLKGVAKLSYNLDKKDDATDKALDAIAAMGNEGTFVAERLVKFTPELSVSEYRSLSPAYKAIIDKVLTIKPGMPTLEIVEPKAK